MLLNSDREEIIFLIRTPGQTNHLNAGFHILGLLFQCDWLQCWPLKDCHISSWVWGAALTIVIYFAAVACMFFSCWHSPWVFLLFTWLSFVSRNLFVYGCSLSRTRLKMKLLVSKVWFVLVNLSTIENSTTSSFKNVQGSTIFLIPLLDDNEFCLLKMLVSHIFSHLQRTFKNNLENFHLSSCIVLYSLCVFTFLFLMLSPLKILWYCNGFFSMSWILFPAFTLLAFCMQWHGVIQTVNTGGPTLKYAHAQSTIHATIQPNSWTSGSEKLILHTCSGLLLT